MEAGDNCHIHTSVWESERQMNANFKVTKIINNLIFFAFGPFFFLLQTGQTGEPFFFSKFRRRVK